MGHSEDDAVHKIPLKMKTHWQNQLKISVLIWFDILYRIRYKKIDVTLVQCPFKDYNCAGCISPLGHSVLLPEIQTSLSWKPKIVFNSSKTIIWTYSFAKTKKQKTNKKTGFVLFKSTFLGTRSLSNPRWFTVKDANLGREICIYSGIFYSCQFIKSFRSFHSFWEEEDLSWEINTSFTEWHIIISWVFSFRVIQSTVRWHTFKTFMFVFSNSCSS